MMDGYEITTAIICKSCQGKGFTIIPVPSSVINITKGPPMTNSCIICQSCSGTGMSKTTIVVSNLKDLIG